MFVYKTQNVQNQLKKSNHEFDCVTDVEGICEIIVLCRNCVILQADFHSGDHECGLWHGCRGKMNKHSMKKKKKEKEKDESFCCIRIVLLCMLTQR